MRVCRVPIALLAVAVAAAALAAPPEVPAEVKAVPGQPVRVVVKGTDVGYKAAFADADAFFEELAPQPGTRRFMFYAQTPGTYVVVFWTKGETDGVFTRVVVGGTPPPQPPGPGPVACSDPAFCAALKAAYLADPDPTKAANVPKLAALYRTAAATTAQDPTVKTNADLFADILTARKTLGIPDPPAMAVVRKAIGDREGGGLLKNPAAPIDRAAAAAELKLIADALDGATK